MFVSAYASGSGFAARRRLFGLVCGLVVLCVMMGCTALTRGVRQGEVLSSAKPPLTAKSLLPYRLGGRAAPFISADIGFWAPQSWFGIYGGESPAAPLAIVALSVAPEGATWDLPSICYVDGPVSSEVAFGDRNFVGAVRMLSATDDAFTPLIFPQGGEEAANFVWLAQRYTRLDFFRTSKIVLEYREPLPASLKGQQSLPTYSPDVAAFAARAQAAFAVEFTAASDLAPTPQLEDVNQRYLGKFLGTLSPVDLPFPESD